MSLTAFKLLSKTFLWLCNKESKNYRTVASQDYVEKYCVTTLDTVETLGQAVHYGKHVNGLTFLWVFKI